MSYGRVILADRHPQVMEGVRGLLGTVFKTVVMVADSHSLFEAVEKMQPDLAIVDLSLSTSGEANIARQLRDRCPELKFIILAVHDEEIAVNAARESGAAGVVLRHAAGTDLLPAVAAVLGGNAEISLAERS